MEIFWATSELGYSALRPKHRYITSQPRGYVSMTKARHFLRGSDVFVSLPTGIYISERVYATVCYPGPSIFSGNGGETHPATCPLYRTHWLPRLAGRTKYFPTFRTAMAKERRSEQLNTLLAVAIARFHFILETISWRTARAGVKLHSCCTQKPVQILRVT